MDFKAEISKLKTIFIDIAPIIYYIEGHNQFGKFSKEVVDAFLTNDIRLKQVKEIRVIVLADYI